MIGQQKRLLEHVGSSQPVKYQKHSDDKLSEAHTRVASLTAEKLEFEQHFSGVSQKNNTFSVSPGGCNSVKVFERVPASEVQKLPNKGEGTSEPEIGVGCGSHESSALSHECEGVVRMAENPSSQSAKVSTAGGHEEDMGHSLDRVNKTQAVGSVGVGADFSPLSASMSEKNGMNNNRSLLGSPSRDLTVQLFGDQPIGLIQASQDPSTLNETVNSRSTHCSRSLPVLLSEKVIDLYVMDEQVQSYGGYEIVTSEGSWGNISEALGLGSDCGPGLKLIYFKYLKKLERERERGLLLERHQHDSDLIGAVNTKVPCLPNENGLLDDNGENYSLTESDQFAESEPFHGKSVEEEKQLNSISSNIMRGSNPLDVDHSEDEAEKAKSDSEYRAGPKPFTGSCSVSKECQDFPEAFLSDHHRFFKGHIDHQHHLLTGGPAALKQNRELGTSVEDQSVVYDAATIERFKKSLADTLMWIKRIAVEPANAQMGQGPEGTGQNERWVAECASQAQKVRALLWRRREDVRWGDGHSHQAKQQVPPPAIYYEDLTRQEQHQAPERPRATRETRERAAHHGSTVSQKPFNESHRSPPPSSNQQPQWAGQTSQLLSSQNHHKLNEERYPEEFFDRPRRRVPIGDDFQAHVPSFRSVDQHSTVAAGPSEDETQSSEGNNEEDHSRWLGKQVWPPPGSKRFPCKESDLEQSSSRPSFCPCQDPESMCCVRRHIEEERERLKLELGQAFYIWKFDQMGECMAGKWAKDEQHTYQTLVQMNPPSRGKNFWDQLPEAFPGKNMKELVSYYFNAFVLRRRAIQNRLDAQHVDSDDDETHYPECDSGDSDYYESGDEDEEEEDQENESENEDETEEEEEEDDPYGSESSAKLLEDTGFCEVGGYSSKLGAISPLDDVPMTVRTARLMNLEDVEEHGYHDPHQDEATDRLHTAHLMPKWSHHHQHDGDDHEKHLENISIVGDEELREVKTWEASHWDEADHNSDLGHDPLAKGISSKNNDEQALERDPSPLYNKKAVEHNTSLVGSCEGQVWGPTMDIAPINNKRDKLLSTKGMIQEFFGNEASGLNSSG